MASEVIGIHQSDVIIRSALQFALNDMRANPWLLDYVFANLPADGLTADEYGAKEIQRAKDWFLKTKIKIQLNVNPNTTATYPCVSVALMSSAEQEQEGTLGDTHYVPFEANDSFWPTLIGPFTLVNYDSTTGYLTLDPNQVGDFVFAPGMNVVDSSGAAYPVLEVVSDSVVQIAKDITTGLTDILIKSGRPAQVVEIGSAVYRETYSIGCHVDSEPIHLIYLHSIVVFALLSYKQSLLEARGFERTTLNSTDLRRDDENAPEMFYDRYVQITGTVRQVWPISITSAISSTKVELVASNTDDTQEAVILPSPDETEADSNPPTAPPRGSQAVFWGQADQPGSVNQAFVQLLANSVMANGRQATLNFVAGATQFCWYATPQSFGGTPQDFIDQETGLEGGWTLVTTVAIGGVTYNVWRSNQDDLGNLTIVVF